MYAYTHSCMSFVFCYSCSGIAYEYWIIPLKVKEDEFAAYELTFCCVHTAKLIGKALENFQELIV